MPKLFSVVIDNKSYPIPFAVAELLGKRKAKIEQLQKQVDRCIAIAEKFHDKAGSAGHILVTGLDADTLLEALEEDRHRRDRNDD